MVLHRAGGTICIPKKGNIIKLMEKVLESFLANEEANIYSIYGTLVQKYCPHALPEYPAD